MKTIQLHAVADPSTAARAIASNLLEILGHGKNVTWLLSGGSCIPVAVLARNMIGSIGEQRLHIGLIDERYGPVGHKNSNWQQLIEGGFEFSGVTAHPILKDGESIASTTQHYNLWLKQSIEQSTMLYGLFGIGEDGHTAGLLPGNPLMNSEELVGSYQGDDFSRISVTPALIEQMECGSLYAVGPNKRWALNTLLQDEPADVIPARILKYVSELKVYTDYKGGE